MTTNQLTKEQALKLVGDLARASSRHYAVVNSLARGKPGIAADRELAAATRLMEALTTEPVTAQDLDEALGW